MPRNYLLPPTYRAGQGSRVASGVKDVLTLADFILKLKEGDRQEAQDSRVLYQKEAIQERRDKSLAVKQRERDIYLHSQDMEKLNQQVQIQKDEEKRRYGKGGYEEQSYILRDKLTRATDKEGHNRGLLATYDTQDLEYDKDGWAVIKPGVISKEDKSKEVDNVLKMSGMTVEYSKDPNSPMQSLYNVFTAGATTSHPSMDVRVEDGEYQFYYKDTNKRDTTPGVFSGPGDVTQSLLELNQFVENVGGTEEARQAVDNMFMKGLASPNPLFMKPSEYSSYKKSMSSLKTDKLNQRNLITAYDSAIPKLERENMNRVQGYADDEVNAFKARILVKSGDEKSLNVRKNVTSSLKNLSIPIKDGGRNRPDLVGAASTLFGLGPNPLEGTDTIISETTEDFLAKFKWLDTKGRGGGQSTAEQVFREMGMIKEYPRFKSILEGTNKDVKSGSVSHKYLIDGIDTIYSQYAKEGAHPFAVDILDRTFTSKGIDNSGWQSGFLTSLDDWAASGDLTYVDENGKLKIIFITEEDFIKFIENLIPKYPEEMREMELLQQQGLAEFEIYE